MQNILTRIHEGMKVVDANDKHVGTVDYVQFGDEDLSQPGVQTSTVTEPIGTNPINEMIQDIFNPGEVAEPIRSHLMRYGFIRIDPGLLRSNRFVAADQIAAVAEDKVRLMLTADELARPTE